MAAAAVLDLSGLVPSSFPPAGMPGAVIPFAIEVKLDALDVDTDDDTQLVFKFPSVAWIHNVTGAFNLAVLADTELDTDDTETLELDLAITDVDGVIDYQILAGSGTTIGEKGGVQQSAIIVAPGNPCWIDVGDKYLAIIVETKAATPADGSVHIGGSYTQNLVFAEVSSTNL